MKRLILTTILTGLMLSGYAADQSFLNEIQKPGQDYVSLIPDAEKKEDSDLYLGIIYHNLAQKDPETYVQKALKHLDDCFQKTENPLARAYYGSAVTLEGDLAQKQNNLIKATRKVDEGCKIIDQMVKENPEHLMLRQLRIEHGLGLSESSPFSRYEEVEKDLKYLESFIAASDKENLARIYLNYGRLYLGTDRINSAFEYFEKTLQTAPRSVYAKEADRYLWELEE